MVMTNKFKEIENIDLDYENEDSPNMVQVTPGLLSVIFWGLFLRKKNK